MENGEKKTLRTDHSKTSRRTEKKGRSRELALSFGLSEEKLSAGRKLQKFGWLEPAKRWGRWNLFIDYRPRRGRREKNRKSI